MNISFIHLIPSLNSRVHHTAQYLRNSREVAPGAEVVKCYGRHLALLCGPMRTHPVSENFSAAWGAGRGIKVKFTKLIKELKFL